MLVEDMDDLQLKNVVQHILPEMLQIVSDTQYDTGEALRGTYLYFPVRATYDERRPEINERELSTSHHVSDPCRYQAPCAQYLSIVSGSLLYGGREGEETALGALEPIHRSVAAYRLRPHPAL